MDIEYVAKMKQYAKVNNVPIVEDSAIDVICELIRTNNSKKILEIGSAIGYSAYLMHCANDCQVTTIERSEDMFNQAERNIKYLEVEEKITLIKADALLYNTDDLSMYDILYIDAAKSQYENFLNKYLEFVKQDGLIIFDNLDFHGYVNTPQSEIKSRNLRQMMRKLKKFNENIAIHPKLDFEYIASGDGLGIARWKERT